MTVETGPQPPISSSSGPARLRLYVARSTPNSVRAEQNLAAVLASVGEGAGALVPDVIDVFVQGKRAVVDGVIVTPTLVVVRGEKRFTVVGDLSDATQLRALLEDVAAAAEVAPEA